VSDFFLCLLAVVLPFPFSGTDRNVSLEVSTRQINEQIPFGQRSDRELTNYVNKYKQVGSGFGFVSQPTTAFGI